MLHEFAIAEDSITLRISKKVAASNEVGDVGGVGAADPVDEGPGK
jgi:hypothetical protein